MGVRAYLHKARVTFHLIRVLKNWPSFLLAHLRRQQEPMAIQLRNGMSVKLRPSQSDATMLMETWGMRYYTPPSHDVGPDDTVVDIGGHIGSFTLYAATRTKETVLAFEPFPESFSLLQENVRRNRLKNVILEQKAVFSRTGKMDLHLYDGPHSGSNSLFHRNTGRKMRIQTITLDDAFRKHRIAKVDFMKIDCEGAEYDILFSLPKATLRKIRRISMEYHDAINEHNHAELMRFFAENGYRARLEGEFIYAVRA